MATYLEEELLVRALDDEDAVGDDLALPDDDGLDLGDDDDLDADLDADDEE